MLILDVRAFNLYANLVWCGECLVLNIPFFILFAFPTGKILYLFQANRIRTCVTHSIPQSNIQIRNKKIFWLSARWFWSREGDFLRTIYGCWIFSLQRVIIISHSMCLLPNNGKYLWEQILSKWKQRGLNKKWIIHDSWWYSPKKKNQTKTIISAISANMI